MRSSASSSSSCSPNASYNSFVRGAPLPPALRGIALSATSSPGNALYGTVALRRCLARLIRNIPEMTPKRRTTPAAPKTHFWFETREDMSENQPSSAVGTIVPLAVGFVDGLEGSSKAGLSASPSASPWSPGRWSVGFACTLDVALGRWDTTGPLGLGTEGSAFSNRESWYSPAIDASIVEP